MLLINTTKTIEEFQGAKKDKPKNPPPQKPADDGRSRPTTTPTEPKEGIETNPRRLK